MVGLKNIVQKMRCRNCQHSIDEHHKGFGLCFVRIFAGNIPDDINLNHRGFVHCTCKEFEGGEELTKCVCGHYYQDHNIIPNYEYSRCDNCECEKFKEVAE